MRKITLLVLIKLGILILSGCCFAQRADSVKLSPKEYLAQAVQIIKKNALNKDSVDWSQIDIDALASPSKVQNVHQVYPIIEDILLKLKDKHSSFVAPGRPNEGSKKARTEDSRGSENKEYYRISSGVGYIKIRSFKSVNKEEGVAYAQAIKDSINKQRLEGVDKWIIDLRENRGGNMWPMLTGLSDLLGNGVVGGFKKGNERNYWLVENGKVSVSRVYKSFGLSDTEKVAVLIGPKTASSGEAVVISFIGRPDTKFFGLPTRGVSTSNSRFVMPDKAVIILTTLIMTDRFGTVYASRIKPDKELDYEKLGENILMDEVLKWLKN